MLQNALINTSFVTLLFLILTSLVDWVYRHYASNPSKHPMTFFYFTGMYPIPVNYGNESDSEEDMPGLEPASDSEEDMHGIEQDLTTPDFPPLGPRYTWILGYPTYPPIPLGAAGTNTVARIVPVSVD